MPRPIGAGFFFKCFCEAHRRSSIVCFFALPGGKTYFSSSPMTSMMMLRIWPMVTRPEEIADLSVRLAEELAENAEDAV